MTIAFLPETPPATETSTPPVPVPPADSTAERVLEDRFVAAVNALFDEADAHKSAATLVDVLAWALARMILRVDSPWGAGDVMRRVGNYVCALQERNAAQREAEDASKEGRAPH